MSIDDLTLKSKSFLEKVRPFYALFLIVILASIFFALWQISENENRRVPIKIEYAESPTSILASSTRPLQNQEASVVQAVSGSPSQATSEEVIGSKSGKKYYFPWCGTVKRIKPENQVHFATIEMARAAGYTPAANCKGLK